MGGPKESGPPGPQLSLLLPICYVDLCKEFPFPGSQFPYIQKMKSLNQKISFFKNFFHLFLLVGG